MKSYLSENEAAETYRMAMSILFKFLTLKWDISRTIWCIEVSNGSCFFFLAFFTLFHLSLTFFRPEFPFKLCSFILCAISQSRIGGNYPFEMAQNCSD